MDALKFVRRRNGIYIDKIIVEISDDDILLAVKLEKQQKCKECQE
jgi:hypothetical protein